MLLTVQSLPFGGEGGNWCRVFVQMEVLLVPLSGMTFSEMMSTTTITGMLWPAPEFTLASTSVITCCCSLVIMLIFNTRREKCLSY